MFHLPESINGRWNDEDFALDERIRTWDVGKNLNN
jgi:hypothetical protein